MFIKKNDIWAKPNPMPESVTDRCTKAHEYIFLLSKSERYYFDSKAIQEEANYDGRKDLINHGSAKYSTPSGWDTPKGSHNGKIGNYQNGKKTQTFAGGEHERWQRNESGEFVRNKRSVWNVSTKPFSGAHFATFPEDLILPMMLAGCPQGGVVLDPFMGAGTTALVAKKNGCRFVGCELNPEYIKIAEKRLAQDYLF